MQVDLLNNKYSAGIGFVFEKIKKYFGYILFFALLFFRGCVNNPTPVLQTTKPINGTFKTEKPIQKALTKENITQKINEITINGNQSYIDKQTILYFKDLEKRYSKLLQKNDSLIENFKKATELQKEKEYEKAIALKSFEKKYDNEDLTAAFNGVVSGEVKEVNFTYELKPVPETKFRILLGGGAGINKELNQGLFKLNAGYQNKKGNIYRVSFMQIGNQKFGIVEYDFSILNRKK